MLSSNGSGWVCRSCGGSGVRSSGRARRRGALSTSRIPTPCTACGGVGILDDRARLTPVARCRRCRGLFQDLWDGRRGYRRWTVCHWCRRRVGSRPAGAAAPRLMAEAKSDPEHRDAGAPAD